MYDSPRGATNATVQSIFDEYLSDYQGKENNNSTMKMMLSKSFHVPYLKDDVEVNNDNEDEDLVLAAIAVLEQDDFEARVRAPQEKEQQGKTEDKVEGAALAGALAGVMIGGPLLGVMAAGGAAWMAKEAAASRKARQQQQQQHDGNSCFLDDHATFMKDTHMDGNDDDEDLF